MGLFLSKLKDVYSFIANASPGEESEGDPGQSISTTRAANSASPLRRRHRAESTDTLSETELQSLRQDILSATRLALEEGFLWSSESCGLSQLCQAWNLVVQRDKIHTVLKDSDSQQILDSLQLLLQCGSLHLSPTRKKEFLEALLEMSSATNLYPTCLALKQVDIQKIPLSAGQFGDVYRGEFRQQHLIIKVVKRYQNVDSEIAKFLLREGNFWNLLLHDNLLPFYGIYRMEDWLYPDSLCLVSPWMDCGNVLEYLKPDPPINRLWLLSDIASGLAYLHKSDIVHGDLKGTNVIVTSSGHASITDFGLTKLVDLASMSWTSTNGGSARWKAPELLADDDQNGSTPRKEMDIYAYGCVCYEVMTGKLPFFEYRREASVILNVIGGSRPSKPDLYSEAYTKFGLTDALWELMEECWGSNPLERPAASGILKRSVLSAKDTRPALSIIDGSWFRSAMATLSCQ